MGLCESVQAKSFEKKIKTERSVKINSQMKYKAYNSSTLNKNKKNGLLFQYNFIENKSSEDHNYILPDYLAKRVDLSEIYKLSEEPIGKGAYGEVFIAENFKGEKFAVKKIYKKELSSLEQIIQEAEISLKVKHKNIINYYGIYEDYDYINYIMELGETDLFEFIKYFPSKCIPENLIIDFLIQIFEVTDYLHNQENIIHCDLKPENFIIKLNKNNIPVLKLVDFGLAINKPKNNGKIKRFRGTKEYAPPETTENNSFTEKVDEWAIGIIMYELLTGINPFLGESEEEIRDKIKFSEINFNLIQNTYLRELNKKLLNKYVAKRIAVKEALEEIKKIKGINNKQKIYYSESDKNQRQYMLNWKELISKLQLINIS